MIEIRWHGRGGQGAVTSVELLALAAIEEGQYAQGFPAFGPERRGAPVLAFNRIDAGQIKVRSGIYQPGVVVVLDSSLVKLVNVTEGLKAGGTLIVNTTKAPGEVAAGLKFGGRLYTVDATRIAREELGTPITNTTMLGALVKATGVIRLESLRGPLGHRFGKMALRNMRAMKRAYDELRG